jgi:D-serine deaminase-like pyridoxal phosphate-dependent protein
VLVDCDTGLGRTGVQSPEQAVALARAVAGTDGLRFEGFLTYPAPPDAAPFLNAAAEGARSAGLEPRVVSAGGTPTMWRASELAPPVNEYRVGVYAFNDRKTIAAGAAEVGDVALTVHATVVSRPTRDRAILDAGSKALSADTGPEDAFGLVLEAPKSRITQLNEEHAYVAIADGEELELGQPVRVVPNHACNVSNLFDEFLVVRDGAVVARWPVAARGKSR